MAADVDYLINEVRELVNTIKDSSLFGSTRVNNRKTNTERFAEQKKNPVQDAADRQRIQKAMQEGTKALKETFKNQENFGRDMKVANRMFQSSVDKMSLKNFDQLPARISQLTKNIGMEFKTKADIDKALQKYDLDNIKACKDLHDKLLTLTIGTKKYNDVLDELTKKWGVDFSDLSRTEQQLIETATKFGEAIKQDTLATEQHAVEQQMLTKIVSATAEVLGYLGKQAYDTAIATAKYGVDFTTLGIDMKKLGMSADQLATIQNDNLQAIRGTGDTIKQFDAGMTSAATELAGYTGSLEGGAKIYAQAYKNARLLSSSHSDQVKIIQQTENVYKLMHDTVGMTSDDFLQLNQNLMNNQDIQENMYRLGQSQRVQAYAQLDQQYTLLRTMGLLDNQAQAVQATFAQMAAQGPKERLKQSAQLQAVGSALGMGKEAAQLAAMLRSGDTSSPQFAALVKQMQTRAQQQYANVKGTAGEFAQYALTNIPGYVQQILGQKGSVAQIPVQAGQAEGPQTAKAVADAAAAQSNQHKETLGKVVSLSQQIAGISKILTIIAGTVEAIAALQGFKGIPSVVKFLRGGGGALGKVGGLAEGGLAEGGLATGALATTGAIAGGAAIGYGMGTLLNKAPELWGGEDLSTHVDNLIEKMVGYSTGPKPEFSKRFAVPPKANPPAQLPVEQREKIVSRLIDEKESELKKQAGHDQQQAALVKQLDALTIALAKLAGKDPAKAVEDLHKTIKQQHMEDKQLTQEQTDAINKNNAVVMRKTSGVTPAAGTTG